MGAPAGTDLDAILNGLGVAVYTTDANGAITFFNEAAASFWGRRPELGEAWSGAWRLYWPDGRPMASTESPIAVAVAENLTETDRQSMLDDIGDESSRLLGIIENLLLLTRLGSGSNPDLEPQMVARVVRSAVEVFERHHPLRTVSMVVESHQLVVEADRSHLEMLVDNLLTNAAKYSPPDSPIEVVVGSEGNEAMVTVLDRGIGIGDAEEGELFTAFYRTDVAKTRTSGLGIGLAVCRRIVDSLGGRIWARPREGGGTEAGFALPLAEDSAE